MSKLKNMNQKRNQFIKQIEFVEDKDRKILLDVQKSINNNGNDKEYIKRVINKLTLEQVGKLEQQYVKDIEKLQAQIKCNKRKMLSLKSEW